MSTTAHPSVRFLSMPHNPAPVISNGCQCLNGVLEAIKDMDIPGYITREDFSYSTYIFRELRTSQVRVVRGLTGLLSWLADFLSVS